MSQDTVSEVENSTNVRSNPHSAARWGLATLSRLAPGTATRLAKLLFCHPFRRPRPRHEAAWLDTAVPFQIEVGQRKLAAWSWGDGPTVLLQHGWSGRGSQLGAFVPGLLAEGFSVVTYDLPAHGDSTGFTTNGVEIGWLIPHVARAVSGITGVIAHSLGCTGVALALREQLRTRRVVFLNPPADMMYYSQLFARHCGFPEEVRDNMQRSFERELHMSWEEFRAECLGRDQTTPLLIVHDRHDRQVPLSHGQRLHEAWPNSQLEITRGLGHSGTLTEPAVIARATAFLKEGRETVTAPEVSTLHAAQG
jgi:pimeloyl-ACP methyl ester carboxylesterase